MTDGKNFSDQPAKSNLKTYDNIQKIATDQGDDYATGCLSGYNYFNNYYKMIAIDLSKQEKLDADPKTIPQIEFIGNPARNPVGKITVFFIIKEAKETILDISQETVKVLWISFTLI